MTSDENPIRLAAIAHSKHRNAFGLVGIEVNPQERKVYVKLVKQWDRNQLNEVPSIIGKLYSKIKWGVTYIDQQTGQHFITDLKRNGLAMKIITTQKNVKDADEIEKIQTMDKIEMVQFMLTLRQKHQVEFPPQPSLSMKQLEKQMVLFSEKTTEAGNIDYFAPGNELDNLPKALLIACFAARKYLDNPIPVHVGGQIPLPETSPFDTFGGPPRVRFH